jgi:hypothetical protein
MSNKIYDKAKAIAAEAQKQMKEYLAKEFENDKLTVECEMRIHNIPECEMPEDSEAKIIENGRYLVYSPGFLSNVTMFSPTRKVRFVYDDEPEIN